jgi:hypothetical protein
MQAVTITKIPSANSVVSTMTPMISSPHGNKSRAIATNADMGTNASLDEQGIAPVNVKLNCSRINTVLSRFFRQKIAIVSF